MIPNTIQEPAKPPKIALKSKADWNIDLNAVGTLSKFIKKITNPTKIYKAAMMGTNMDEILLITFAPPKNITAANSANNPPITYGADVFAKSFM